MQSTLQLQIRPLISSLGSLEKVIQIQEDRRENNLARPSPAPSSSIHWTYEKIESIVQDSLVQKYPHLSDTVTSVTVDNLMIQQREYLLNEINRQQNELRRETELTEREFLIGIKKRYEEKFQELNGGIRETRYGTVSCRSSLDLPNSCSLSLSLSQRPFASKPVSPQRSNNKYCEDDLEES
jgi:hypothetical protein